jgi:hypothetical protein
MDCHLKPSKENIDFLMFRPFRIEEHHHIVQSFLDNDSSEMNTTKICNGVY